VTEEDVVNLAGGLKTGIARIGSRARRVHYVVEDGYAVAELYQSEQRFLSLTRLFSGITLLIGCLGIYGLILFFVAQKNREIGIRKVLGGGVGHILVLVSQDFLKLLIVGALIATPLAWYFLDQWLQSYEYKTPISWWIFLLATAIVAIVTLVTISYQALKAALANPVKSLRTE
jgi:ABC-type antimicrobial peptide transport system permease subunit